MRKKLGRLWGRVFLWGLRFVDACFQLYAINLQRIGLNGGRLALKWPPAGVESDPIRSTCGFNITLKDTLGNPKSLTKQEFSRGT